MDINFNDTDNVIQKAIDTAVSNAVNPLKTQVSNLEGRVKALEDSAGEAPTEPEPEPVGVSDYTVTRTSTGIIFDALVDGYNTVTLRISATPITTQEGWYYPTPVPAEGRVKITTTAQNSGTSYYWRLEDGSNRNNVLVSGQVAPYTAPENPTPTPTEPITGDMTGGSGGALTDRTNLTFRNSAGMSSSYHIYASGLNWSKPVGVLIYGDGSGGYGFDNPSSSYLVGGTSGIAAVAKRLNLLVIFPVAPAPGCPSDNCWYDSTAGAKARWAADLVLSIYKQYNLDKSRVIIAGYSSGAQLSSQFLFPAHGRELMTGGVIIPISYGGAPRVTSTLPDSLKSTVVLSWDCGADDSSALSASRAGEQWYRSRGWKTQLNVVPNVGHGRSGQFGTIVEREGREHLRSI